VNIYLSETRSAPVVWTGTERLVLIAGAAALPGVFFRRASLDADCVPLGSTRPVTAALWPVRECEACDYS
jgi:hypothetical protein